MRLERQDALLGQYRVALGVAPTWHEEREGDGRTPEGDYRIDARNPRSAFREIWAPVPTGTRAVIHP